MHAIHLWATLTERSKCNYPVQSRSANPTRDTVIGLSLCMLCVNLEFTIAAHRHCANKLLTCCVIVAPPTRRLNELFTSCEDENENWNWTNKYDFLHIWNMYKWKNSHERFHVMCVCFGLPKSGVSYNPSFLFIRTPHFFAVLASALAVIRASDGWTRSSCYQWASITRTLTLDNITSTADMKTSWKQRTTTKDQITEINHFNHKMILEKKILWWRQHLCLYAMLDF